MTQSEPKPKKRPAKPTPNGKTEVPLPEPAPKQSFTQRLERFGWDLLGVVLLTAGLIMFVGVLRISRGTFLDELVRQLDRWFGLGRFLLPVVLLSLGYLLLMWRKGEARKIGIGRVLMLELAFFTLLAAVSAFSGDLVEHVETGQSFAGLVGWGLANPLLRLFGWLPAGLIYGFLTLLFVLGGFNLFGRLETWAQKKAGVSPTLVPPLPERSIVETVASAKASVADKPAETVRQRPRKESQPSLPFQSGRASYEEITEKPKGQPEKRSEALPPLGLLDQEIHVEANQATINMNAGLIEKTLAEFGIPAKVVGYRVGPTVTQYAVEPGYVEKGSDGSRIRKIRISQISSLNRDLALALKAERLRIEAPVRGKSYVGIEVPNATHTIVRLKPILESENFARANSPLAIALGRDVSGQPMVADLSTMPHLLIAGTTNSGKSVCIAAITTCLVLNNKPEDLKLVMIDPKMVELTRFNGLPHLLGQVETNVERIMGVLRWATSEMDHRYKLLESMRARNLDSYNSRMERTGQPTLPRIVILIDELADLMMSAPDVTESTLARLAQKARAVGMHLVVATQRPSTDIVTGVIKANFPTRIAFTVASMIDSRVILDTQGAETLLGKGDMLYLHPEVGIPQRSQGVMVSDTELQRVMRWWAERGQSGNEALPILLEEPEQASPEPQPESAQEETQAVSTPEPVVEEVEPEAPWEDTVQQVAENGTEEGLIKQAIELLRKDKRANTSYFQRQLRLGYPKAAWLVDQLEQRGILGPAQSGGKEREIFLDEPESSSEEAA